MDENTTGYEPDNLKAFLAGLPDSVWSASENVLIQENPEFFGYGEGTDLNRRVLRSVVLKLLLSCDKNQRKQLQRVLLGP